MVCGLKVLYLDVTANIVLDGVECYGSHNICNLLIHLLSRTGRKGIYQRE